MDPSTTRLWGNPSLSIPNTDLSAGPPEPNYAPDTGAGVEVGVDQDPQHGS